MTEMYDDLLEEYKNSVFQVSKISKGFMKKNALECGII